MCKHRLLEYWQNLWHLCLMLWETLKHSGQRMHSTGKVIYGGESLFLEVEMSTMEAIH